MTRYPSNPTPSYPPSISHTRPFLSIHDGMKKRCMGKARMQWTNAYVRWRLSDGASRHEKRPSLKLSLQGPSTVCGVDGRPVMLIKRPSGSFLSPSKRHLSFNCPRYISVGVFTRVLSGAVVATGLAADRLRPVVGITMLLCHLRALAFREQLI